MTRIQPEDPQAVRDRDKANLDTDLADLGDGNEIQVFGDPGGVGGDQGHAPRRRTRTVADGEVH